MLRLSKPWLAAVLFGICCLLLVEGQARSGEKKPTGPLLSKEDSLTSDDGKDTHPDLTNSYRKTYKVKFAEGKTYKLDMKSKDFDAVLRIENSDGKEVAFNDDAPGQMTLDSQIVYKAEKGGEFTIVATSLDADATGKFALTVVEGLGGKGVPLAKGLPLKLDKEGNASDANELKDGDEQKGGKFYKSYTLAMKAGTAYTVKLKSDDFDAYLVLLDPKGKVLDQNDDDPAGGTLDSRLDYTARADGDYRVIATSLNANESGKYSLEISSKPGEKVAKVPAGKAIDAKLKDGKYSYDGNLGDGDDRVGGKFSKSFKVTLTEGKTYVIDMMSQAFDTYLYLDGPDGKLISEDDDGGEGLNSRITYKAEKTGVYNIRASTFDNGGAGAFTLTIGSEDDKGGKGEKEAKVPVGKHIDAKLKDGKYTYEGALENSDPVGVRGCYVKTFKFALEEGNTYVFDHMAPNFDAYLFLDGPDGKLITEDDDGGEGLNSRITYKAEKSGVYTMRVTSLFKREGAFTFEIRVGDEKEAKNSGLQQRLKSFDKATPEDRKAIADEVVKTLADKGADMTIADARMGMLLAYLVGDDDVKLSRETIKGLIKAIASADDPKIAGAVKALEMNLAKLDQIGKSMDVKGALLDGKEFDLKNLKGKVVLVDFWATWCGPCIAELPNMQSAYEKYHGKGFEIIGISLDRDEDALAKFIENKKLPWACINLEDSKKLASLYKVNAIPHPVLIDQAGNIVSLNARGPRLERLIERLISDRK